MTVPVRLLFHIVRAYVHIQFIQNNFDREIYEENQRKENSSKTDQRKTEDVHTTFFSVVNFTHVASPHLASSSKYIIASPVGIYPRRGLQSHENKDSVAGDHHQEKAERQNAQSLGMAQKGPADVADESGDQ